MLFAYLTGHVKIANYLQIQYVPGVGELTIFCGAIAGAGWDFSGTTPTRRSCSWGYGFPCPGRRTGSGRGDGEAGDRPRAGGGSLRGGGSLGDLPGDLLQDPEEKDLPDGADPPPLRVAGMGGAKIIVRFWIISIILALLAISTLKIR